MRIVAQEISQRESFRYRGSIISEDGERYQTYDKSWAVEVVSCFWSAFWSAHTNKIREFL